MDWTVTVEEDGVAVNVAGYAASFMIKASVDDLDAAALATVTGTLNTPTTDGVLNFSLSSAATDLAPGKYLGEYKITPNGGDPYRVQQDVVIGKPIHKA